MCQAKKEVRGRGVSTALVDRCCLLLDSTGGAKEEAKSCRPLEKHEQVVTESLAVKVKQELKGE